MREMLEEKLARYRQLEQQMLDPAVQADGFKLAQVAREHASVAPVATLYGRLKALNQQVIEAKEMIAGADPEMKELAEAELPSLREKREAVRDELLEMVVGGEDSGRDTLIMEIRAGTGGDEAALFARDLFEMYSHYAVAKGWKVEVLNLSPSELDGIKEVELAVAGDGVFRHLQYESGGHRVQRVPETETKGRVHTSAATVAVLAEPEEVEVDLKPEDYREDIYCASGPGGQHVNKTASAVRLTHFETGIVVAMQDERSQHKNRAKALRLLRSRIYEKKRQEMHDARAAERKSQVGSGDRSERIRTYNFPDNRVTDHRINFTLYKLDQVIAGNLEPVIRAMLDHEKQAQRESLGEAD